MNAERSERFFRPVIAGFILSLLFIFALTTGCAVTERPPSDTVTRIAPSDAAEAGSLALTMQGLLYESATNPMPEKAIAAYSNALKLNPGNKNALSSLVNCLARQKRLEDAYEALRSYPESLPESPRLQLFAAGLAEHLERPVEAAGWCRQVLLSAPTNQAVANAAIRFHFEGGEDDKALELLDDFTGRLAREEALKFSVETIVSLYRDRDKTFPQQALKCSERALKFTVNDEEISDVLMLKAYCQLESARTNAAIRTFEESYRRNPENPVPLAQLGSIYAASPEQMRLLESAPGGNGDGTVPADLVLGYAFNALERFEDAAEALQRHYNARMRRGYFAGRDFYLTLGATYEKTKAYEQIDRLFRDAVCAHPDDPEILNFIAYLWSERGINLDKALRFINTVLRQEPDNPAFLDTKGWILHKAGRNYEALQQLLKACAGDNREPVILDHTGDVLAVIGNDVLAIDFWKLSYIHDPQSAVAEKLKRMDEPIPEIKR